MVYSHCNQVGVHIPYIFEMIILIYINFYQHVNTAQNKLSISQNNIQVDILTNTQFLALLEIIKFMVILKI